GLTLKFCAFITIHKLPIIILMASSDKTDKTDPMFSNRAAAANMANIVLNTITDIVALYLPLLSNLGNKIETIAQDVSYIKAQINNHSNDVYAKKIDESDLDNPAYPKDSGVRGGKGRKIMSSLPQPTNVSGVKADPKFLRDPSALESISSALYELSSYVAYSIPTSLTSLRKTTTNPTNDFKTPINYHKGHLSHQFAGDMES
ncbi:3059_t:CDS:2, partial [Racocetra persica]